MLIKLPVFSDSTRAKRLWNEENKLSSLGELMKSSSKPQNELGWLSAKYKSKSIIVSGEIFKSSEIMPISLLLCLPKIYPSCLTELLS